jgi:hypothetical protein
VSSNLFIVVVYANAHARQADTIQDSRTNCRFRQSLPDINKHCTTYSRKFQPLHGYDSEPAGTGFQTTSFGLAKYGKCPLCQAKNHGFVKRAALQHFS